MLNTVGPRNSRLIRSGKLSQIMKLQITKVHCLAKKDQFMSNFMPNSIKNPRIGEGKTMYLEVWYTFLDSE